MRLSGKDVGLVYYTMQAHSVAKALDSISEVSSSKLRFGSRQKLPSF